MMSDNTAVAMLVDSIIEMADKQTNPVLIVLGDKVAQFHEQQKYPQPPLDFQQGAWRAFYHRHPVPDSDQSEHGHFHIFSRYQDEWVHVVALSMDQHGQPQAWITVNRWVTDGPWVSATRLIQHLSLVNYAPPGLSLCERWLLSLLQVYLIEIKELLEERDRQLQQSAQGDINTETQNNRKIYTLATHKIDLLSKLKKFQAS